MHFRHFWKKDDPYSWIVSEITDWKNIFKWMSKKSRFRGPFNKQHGKGGQTLSKYERHYFYNINWSMWKQLSWKKSLLVICKGLRLFVNTLTAVGKCFFLNRDNLRQPIQIQLSEKQKNFLNFFSEILRGRLNFKHFWKRSWRYRWCISEITYSKKLC